MLVPITFVDDTNVFFEPINIKGLPKTVNDELIKINEWFSANKLSLNVRKTKFFLFPKSDRKYRIPSPLPTLKINNYNIKRVNTMRFFGVYLDKNLSGKALIKYFENKLAKNTGLIYRAKPFFDKESILAL